MSLALTLTTLDEPHIHQVLLALIGDALLVEVLAPLAAPGLRARKARDINSAHPRPSKPSPTVCVSAQKYSIRSLMRMRAVVLDHQQHGGRIWCMNP
jgi:hypothetical protein